MACDRYRQHDHCVACAGEDQMIWTTYTWPLVALVLIPGIFVFGYWVTPWWTDRMNRRRPKA
jgi:hypothetical protein